MTTKPSSSDNAIAAGGAALALLVGVLLFYLRFCGSVAVPARPPERPLMAVDTEQATASLDANREVFRQRIDSDAQRYRVSPAPALADLEQSMPFHEATRRIELSPGKGGPVEVAGLRLQAIHQGHVLALKIENLGDHPVAYRVDTRPALGHRACRHKETLPFNAMALREKGNPAAVAVRSECVYKRGKGLVITRVETVQLPMLSYYYVSRLEPSSVGLSDDAVRGHRPPEGPACQRSLSVAQEAQMRGGQTTWRDLIDFYARHSCEAYRFPNDYKAVAPGKTIELPAVQPE